MKLPSLLKNHLGVIVCLRSTRMISALILLKFVLCPTRWTVRAEALASITENYEALGIPQLKIPICEHVLDYSDGASIQLGRKLLNIVDNSSRSLQAKTMSACEGQTLGRITQASFQSMRNDECFDLIMLRKDY